MDSENTVLVLELKSFEPGEVGEPVEIKTLGGATLRAKWLGVVDGESWTLTDACRLMCELDAERKANES